MGRRILIADGNEDAAESLAVLLRLYGHDPAVALSGSDAITIASKFIPEVAFLSVTLPGVDGLEVCRQLRTAHPRPRLLVALTGYGTESERRAVQEAGFDRQFLKPADPSALLALLR